jgi:hypothetical protein
VTSALRLVFRIETKMHQRVVALAGFHDDIAALTTIAAGRAAARDELLPSKSKAAVAAVAGFDSDYGLVDEHSSQPSAIGKTVVHRWPFGVVIRLRTSDLGRLQEQSPFDLNLFKHKNAPAKPEHWLYLMADG